jgi:phenylpyruvate tautomerase PptA (4-oxalocrotonate tautomerase family)
VPGDVVVGITTDAPAALSGAARAAVTVCINTMASSSWIGIGKYTCEVI